MTKGAVEDSWIRFSEIAVALEEECSALAGETCGMNIVTEVVDLLLREDVTLTNIELCICWLYLRDTSWSPALALKQLPSYSLLFAIHATCHVVADVSIPAHIECDVTERLERNRKLADALWLLAVNKCAKLEFSYAMHGPHGQDERLQAYP